MWCVLQARRGMGFTGGVLSSAPLVSYFLGLSPLTPLLFLAFVLCLWGLVGCLPVFPLVFHGGCGQVW